MPPPPSINRWEGSSASTGGDLLDFNETVHILCAGIYGDHKSCSTETNVYYLADPREICDLGDDYHTVDRLVTPTEWFQSYRPCWTWGYNPETGMPAHVFSQPLSTLYVMMVACFCLWIAFRFWRKWREHDEEKGMYHLSRLLWAVSMASWGLGAFFAGLSYEALEWHLKCTEPGDTYCLAYSWMEIAYVILQCAACNSILIAVAFSCSVITAYWFLIACLFAALDFVIYCICVAIGAFQGDSTLLSFEFCLLMGSFTVMLAVAINVGTYIYLAFISKHTLRKMERNKEVQLALMYAWAMMGLTGVAYWIYLATGIQYSLWCNWRIWFTANDILHIGMTLWAYMIFRLRNRMEDSLHIRNALSKALAMSNPEGLGEFGSFGTSEPPSDDKPDYEAY